MLEAIPKLSCKSVSCFSPTAQGCPFDVANQLTGRVSLRDQPDHIDRNKQTAISSSKI